ncbi:hypothetical protein HaLaN_30998, partial [Haematococcus lacustris]
MNRQLQHRQTAIKRHHCGCGVPLDRYPLSTGSMSAALRWSKQLLLVCLVCGCTYSSSGRGSSGSSTDTVVVVAVVAALTQRCFLDTGAIPQPQLSVPGTTRGQEASQQQVLRRLIKHAVPPGIISGAASGMAGAGGHGQNAGTDGGEMHLQAGLSTEERVSSSAGRFAKD